MGANDAPGQGLQYKNYIENKTRESYDALTSVF
jgi:hypothetical protein